MAYKFKKRRRIDRVPIIRPHVRTDTENLTYTVRGYPASDIEERFARALTKLDLAFWFQYELKTATSLPDQERKVDFLVFYMPGRVQPVEVYGKRWHSSSGDRDLDLQRQGEINREGFKFGWDEVVEVWEEELYNQLAADNTARRLFL